MPSTLVGTEEVEVVPSARRFAKLLAKDVTPAATTLGKQIGAQLSETVARGIRDGLGDGFKAAPAESQRKGRESGDRFAGAFDREVRTKVTAALKSLPDAKIDADASDAERAVAQVRASLQRLAGQRIGIDVDEATALNRLETLQRKLAEISASDDATISVKANTTQAALELDKVRVTAERVGAMSPTVRVDADTAAARAEIASVGSASISSTAGVSGLVAAGLLLGPALIPGAAAAAAAVFGIGAAGLAAASGVGVAVLALSGIGDAIKATVAAEDSAAADAEAASARRVAAARQIQDAKESLGQAEVAQAEQAERATQALIAAERGVRDARTASADGVAAALARVESAEDAQTRAARDAKDAQEGLNTARKDAKAALADLQDQLRQGELSEEQALIRVERARLAANRPMKSGLDKRQAKVDYKQAVADLEDIRDRNKDLAAQKKKADRDGIEGSDGVRAAKQRLIDATQREEDAGKAVADAEAGVLKAREEGAERVAAAQGRVAEAMKEQERSAKRSAASVTRAQRELARAQDDAAKSADKTSAAQSKASKAMAALSPEGRRFAKFILGMRGGLKDLQRDAAKGFLPGLEGGMRAAGRAVAPFRGVVGSVARELGRMSSSAGKSLGGPVWQRFFGMVRSTAAPTLRQVGSILGNVSKGFAGLAVAFQPIATDVLSGLGRLSARFATFAQGGKGSGLQRIIDYVRENGPKFASMLGSLGRAFARIVEAVAPFAGPVMSGIQGVADAIAGMPVDRLTKLIGVVVGLTLAWKTATTVARGVQTVDAIVTAGKKLSTLWTNRETAATVRSTIATRAKTAVTKAATIATRIFNAVLANNPIGRVILVLTALGAGLVLLYKKHEGFRNVVQRVFRAVLGAASRVVTWFREKALPWMRTALTRMGAAASRLYDEHIGPAFSRISRITKSVIGWVRETGLPWTRTALQKIGGVVRWLWTKIYQPYFGFIFNIGKKVFGWVKNTGLPWATAAFRGIGAGAKTLWNRGISPWFSKITSGARGLIGAFRGARDGIGRTWDGLTSMVKKPVVATLNWLENNFLKSVRSVLRSIGADGLAAKIPVLGVTVGSPSTRTTTGRVDGTNVPLRNSGGPIPGPYLGPRADNVLGISDAGVPTARVNPREYIQPVSRVQQYGLAGMEAVRRGTARIVDQGGRVYGGSLPGLAGGGFVYPQMVSWIKKAVPGVGISSTKRNGTGGSFHNVGKAIDIIGSPQVMKAAARAIQQRWGSSILELIHNPGFSIKNGRYLSPADWGPGVWENHGPKNWHVHWAMNALTGGGGSVGGGILSGLAGKVIERGKSALNNLLDKAPKDFWSQTGVAAMRKVTGTIADKVQAMFAQTSDGDTSGGYPRYNGTATSNLAIGRQMAAAYGWTGAEWTALRNLWQRESNWNHRARNPSSGAYGIPQALPASKLAAAGPDWMTNPATQISWGLKYIKDRPDYGRPSKAWALWQSRSPHWYGDGGLVNPAVFDNGGTLAPGLNLVHNKLGRPEPLVRPDQFGLGRGPHTFNIVDRDGKLVAALQGMAADVFLDLSDGMDSLERTR